jgi:hypothetical protein
MTQHRVDFPVDGKGGGRKGPCLEHEAPLLSKKQEARAAREAHEKKNPRLFE